MGRYITILLLFLLAPSVAQEQMGVDQLSPGMLMKNVLAVKGEPDGRSVYSRHAYVVYSSQPLFQDEESWIFERAEGKTVLLFKKGVLRSVRGTSLQWRGKSYSGEEWAGISSRVKADCAGLSVGYNEAPKIKGFYVSDLSPSEQEMRTRQFDRTSGRHHFDARGDIFQGKPGQTCQTCRE